MPDGAAIVINASMVSIKGMPAFGVYAASKAALRSFVRTWAVDLQARKIRVNAVSPGTVVTPGYKRAGMTDELIAGFTLQSALSVARLARRRMVGFDGRGRSLRRGSHRRPRTMIRAHPLFVSSGVSL